MGSRLPALPRAGAGGRPRGGCGRSVLFACSKFDVRLHVCHGQGVNAVRGLMLAPTSNVAILGFGARAQTFAALLAPRGCALRAWDPSLDGVDAATMRTHIEAAGVDAAADLGAALRGARLVVLDAVDAGAVRANLQPGQRLLDLASASAVEIDAVLVALGLPPAAVSWQAACESGLVANCPTSDPDIPVVRRGELP